MAGSLLDSIPTGIELPASGIREYDKNLQAITTISTFRSTALDTVVIRWKRLENSIEYAGSFRDVYDKGFLTFKAESDAAIVVPSSFPSNADLFFIKVARVRREQLELGHMFGFQRLKELQRAEIKSEIEGLTFDKKIEYLLGKNLIIDALSLIELQLMKEDDRDLVEKYWSIVQYSIEAG